MITHGNVFPNSKSHIPFDFTAFILEASHQTATKAHNYQLTEVVTTLKKEYCLQC